MAEGGNLRREMADALGVSGPRISQLWKAGMPRDSVERALRWRDRHLDPARTVSGRADYRQARRRADAVGDCRAEGHGSVELAHALQLAAVASDLLQRDAFEAIEVPLRAALRAVPPHRRAEFEADLRVWDVLCAEVIVMCREVDRELEAEGALEAPKYGSQVVDAYEDDLAGFWYSVAAGELRIAR